MAKDRTCTMDSLSLPYFQSMPILYKQYDMQPDFGVVSMFDLFCRARAETTYAKSG